MPNPSQSVTIAASLAPIILRLLAILAVVLVVTSFFSILKGESPLDDLRQPWSQGEIILAGLAMFFASLSVITVFLACRAFGAKITCDKILGRTEIGRPLELLTPTVTNIAYRSDWYVPGIFVHSSLSDESVFIALRFVDEKKVHRELSKVVGPIHPLTVWFSKTSA